MQPVSHTCSGSLQSYWWPTSIGLEAHFNRTQWTTWSEYAPKHLHRYANEFAIRYNFRYLDTIDQMALIVRGLVEKRLTYKGLIG